MTEGNIEAKLKQELEQDEKEHNHKNPTAEAMTNHVVANLAILWTKLHQYHWYVKGEQFFTLHEKFEALYTDASKWYDTIAETLLTMGAKPFSTTEQNKNYTFLQEDAANKYKSAQEMVGDIVEDFRLTRDVVLRAMDLCHKQNKPVLEDVLIGYKGYLDKEIWMLQAFIGKTALEDEEA